MTEEEYERRARERIDELKNPEPSRMSAVLDVIRVPMSRAVDAALDNKVGDAISSGVQGLMKTLNESASWSVRPEAVYERFRAAGHRGVRSRHDIQSLELREVDRTVSELGGKSQWLAFAEGAGTGVLGLAGTAIDIPSLLAIALRAINQYAAYYSFDTSNADEKAFALMILAVVSSPTVDERQAAMAELTRVSTLLRDGEARAESEHLLSAQTVTKIANTLIARLVRAKSAQTIPILGAGVAATFNAWFVRNVTNTAHQLYRERFLMAKRGPKVAVPVRVRTPATHS